MHAIRKLREAGHATVADYEKLLEGSSSGRRRKGEQRIGADLLFPQLSPELTIEEIFYHQFVAQP